MWVFIIKKKKKKNFYFNINYAKCNYMCSLDIYYYMMMIQRIDIKNKK